MGNPWEKPILPLAGLTIMVNPGHGIPTLEDPRGKGPFGRIGKLPPIFESDINDIDATKIKTKLEQLGAKVVYVDNTSLSDIQKLENKIKPDLFIAIHQDNNVSKEVSGETVYAWTKESLKVASFINDKLKSETSIKNRPINSNDISLAKSYKVLKADESIPAVLVEMGFIRNQHDFKIITSPEYQEIASQKIVEGISDYFESKYPKRTKMEPLERIYTKSIFEKLLQPYRENLIIPNKKGFSSY